MYSATAAAVAKFRAEQARQDDGTHTLFRTLTAHRLADAEQRLIAERDPVQRAALRHADAEQAAEAQRLGRELLHTLGRASTRLIGKATKTVTRVFDRLSAVRRWVERERAALVAQLTSYADTVVSTLAWIARKAEAATTYFATGERTTEVPPLLDLHTHSLIAAPRPGPRAGATLAA